MSQPSARMSVRLGASLRSRGQRLALLLFLLLAFLAVRVQVAADDAEGSLPIQVTFTGLSSAEEEQVQVFAQSSREKTHPFTHLQGTPHWRQYFFFWAHHIRLYLPPTLLERQVPVTVTIGNSPTVTTFTTSTRALAQSWIPVPRPAGHPSTLVGFDSPASVSAPHSLLFPRVINGPDLTPFVEILGRTGLLALVGGIALWLSVRFLSPRSRGLRLLWLCLVSRTTRHHALGEDRRYCLAGLGIVLAALVLLVRGQRYGFVHDDNITQFFPVILQGCESVFKGVFPTYNPYQLLGSPTTSIGTYALTYPLTYLAYGLARYGLRDPYLTLDIFVVLHLTLGYVASYVLARRVGLRPALALCAALSFVLCGFLMVYTRGWFYMAPVALWTPLFLWHLTRLTNPAPLTWRWPVATGIAVGLYFHAGNAQMWAYTLLLGTALLLLWQRTGQLPRGRLLWALGALLIGLALAAPLLLAQSAEVAELDRTADIKQSALTGWLAMLVPSPLVDVKHPGITDGIDRVWEHLFHFSPLYYSGTLFLVAGLLGLSTLLVAHWSRRLVGGNAWLLCGGLALVLSLGEEGGLAQLFALLPVFNKFQHCWKFLPFVALFFALGGGLLVERWLQHTRTRSLERAVLVLVPLLLVYNAWLSRPVMSIVEKPYPALPTELSTLLAQPETRLYRGVSIAPWLPKTKEPGFVSSLYQNFATVYKMPMLEGYDPLVEKSPLNLAVRDRLYTSATFDRAKQAYDPMMTIDPLAALRRYGVRWVFVMRGEESDKKGQIALQRALVGQLAPRLTLPKVDVRELSGCDPLAFVEGAPEHPLPLTLTAEGVEVTLDGRVSGWVVVSFLARERLHAYLDGKPALCTKDRWDRVRVAVPTGTRTLTLRYEPAWGKGFLLSALLLLMALGLVRLAAKIADPPV